MILIADSGSTKCHWALLCGNLDNDIKLYTDGINPFFCTEEQIVSIIKEQLIPDISAYKIDKILFFGAGCLEDKKQSIWNVLNRFFPQADITVDTDLKAAAIALYGNNSGIACIIGTGSISCIYDGSQIVETVYPLGYILGDEGSGAVLGKKFLGDCFKNQIPRGLRQKFFKKYKLTALDIMEQVYRQPFPNRFLASFVPFLKDNILDSYVYNMVFDSFQEFIQRNILIYKDCMDYKVSFCGSVAYHFADILEVVVYECGLVLGKIIASPIRFMADYFRNNIR